jgi:OmpA-OmpF porin, OOP family
MLGGIPIVAPVLAQWVRAQSDGVNVKKAMCAGLALLMAAGLAQAQFYAGGTLGWSDVDASGLDGSDTGFKAYGGYALPTRMLPNLALELGYIDFGEASASGPFSRVSVGASAFTGAAALRFKLAPAVSAVGRLGLANVDATASAGALGVGVATSESSMNLYFGFGLEYALSPQLKVTGSMDFTDYEVGGQSGSVNLMGVGVQYAF